ncbi:MAG: transposase [Gammaproteobacteria bacterium]
MNETIVEQFVGIDVSKATLDVCIEPPREALQVAYDEAGISQIIDRLKLVRPVLIVLEATGGLEVRIATELASPGLPVAVINPRQLLTIMNAMLKNKASWNPKNA